MRRQGGNMWRAASVVLFVFVFVASFLFNSCSALPAFNARGTQALKREKRVDQSCPSVIISSNSIKKLTTHAHWALLPASEAVKWTHFLLIEGENGAKEMRAGEEMAEGKPNVCEGFFDGDESMVLLVQGSQSQYILFPWQPSLPHKMTVRFTCNDAYQPCFQLFSENGSDRSQLRRRNVQDVGPFHSSPTKYKEEEKGRGVLGWLVGVGVAIVGLVGVMATLAMCAHGSQTYEPDVTNSRVSDEVANPTGVTAATKSESLMNLLNEGSSSPDQPSEGKSASSVGSQQSGSQDPLVQSGTGMVAEQVRSKDLSQVNGPTLEVADNVASDSLETREEEEGGYASVTKSDAREYDYVDKTGGVVEDDEAGYAYATVGGAMGGAIGEGPVQPVAEPDGDDKIADKENAQDGEDRGSGLPPYGKVIRHMVPIAKRSDYSEVVSASPLLPPGRPRAVTEPIDPTSSPSMEQHHHCMRDDRAFTESAAHLPLPQIPRLNVNDEMYDSIPDQLRNDATSGATSGGAEKPVRESLYESVEATGVEGDKQADEDMYESVPEDMRQNAPPTPSSPDTLSPSSPFPPPPRSPVNVRTGLKAEGVPASPSLKEREEEDGRKRGKEHVAKDSKNEQKKHKMLSKAKSDSEPRGRSLSSFFNRKKGSSGNAPVSPKLKQLKEPPILPFITASTSSISSPTHHFQPSPPPIPAPPPPDEDEEDYPPDGAYDMIDVLNPRGAAFLAKSRSASLPSAMRNAGGSPFHSYDHGPLPQLPEESAGGLVARQRVKEDMDPEYDTVVLGQVQDDPNYDSVEVSHENEAMPKLELAEPPTGNDGQPKEALTPANKYAKVSSHMAVEGAVSPDHTAVSPEHDELGYAVIPAHLKMKKRAMSDAMKKKKAANEKSTAARPKSAELVEDTFYHTLQDEMETADATGLSLSPPMEPEYESVTDALREAENIAGEKETPYATVDMAAKRRSQFLKQQSGGAGLPLDDFRDNSPSPNPPPLPQQGDLGDLAEFEQPPIPIQAEASLQLIEPSELQRPSAHKIINPYSQIDTLSDPPYASVKKKQLPETTDNAGVAEQNQPDDNYEDENPYATVDNESESIETVSTGASDPPYAKIKRGRVVEDESDPGYEKTGMKVELHDGEAIVKTSQNGATYHDNGEDDDDGTYDRLDHGFGNSATCRANAAVLNHAASDNRECTTVTVDFSSSPELVVTEPGIVDTEINGVVTHTEEKIINFTT